MPLSLKQQLKSLARRIALGQFWLALLGTLMNEKIRLRLRHFLLQKSEHYSRYLLNKNKSSMPITKIAEELSQITGLSQRRLLRLLSLEERPKEVSVRIEDLGIIAQLAQCSPADFLSYLLEERPSNLSLNQKQSLDFLQSLHEGHRRSLNLTVFSGSDLKKSERCIDLVLLLYKLENKDLTIIEEITNALYVRQSSR